MRLSLPMLSGVAAVTLVQDPPTDSSAVQSIEDTVSGLFPECAIQFEPGSGCDPVRCAMFSMLHKFKAAGDDNFLLSSEVLLIFSFHVKKSCMSIHLNAN